MDLIAATRAEGGLFFEGGGLERILQKTFLVVSYPRMSMIFVNDARLAKDLLSCNNITTKSVVTLTKCVVKLRLR